MKKECFIYMDEPGHIEEKSRPTMVKFMKSFPAGRVKISGETKNRRTLNQNDFFHVIFTIIQKGLYDNGYREIKTMEDAKEFCKYRFLRRDTVNELTGEVSTTIKPTSKLTKEEGSVFIEELIQFAAEYLGVIIPDPEMYKNNPKKYDQFSII